MGAALPKKRAGPITGAALVKKRAGLLKRVRFAQEGTACNAIPRNPARIFSYAHSRVSGV